MIDKEKILNFLIKQRDRDSTRGVLETDPLEKERYYSYAEQSKFIYQRIESGKFDIKEPKDGD